MIKRDGNIHINTNVLVLFNKTYPDEEGTFGRIDSLREDFNVVNW